MPFSKGISFFSKVEMCVLQMPLISVQTNVMKSLKRAHKLKV